MQETLMPFLGSSFPLGHAKEFIEAFENPDIRAIAQAEFAYFTGRPDEAFELAKPYMESEDVGLRSSACLIAIYASLPLKKVGQAHNGLTILEHQLMRTEQNGTPDQKLAARFAFEAARALLHLSNGDAPEEDAAKSGSCMEAPAAFSQFLDVLDLLCAHTVLKGAAEKEKMQAAMSAHTPLAPNEGVRLFAAYVLAHRAYLKGEYEFSLGVTTGALAMADAVYPVAFLYLHLIQCMCLISLKMPDQAREVFSRAWKLAQPDGLIQGVAEHHGLLGGLIESCIKPQDPVKYKEIIAITYSFSKGWRMMHNPTTGEDVADNLSTTEFSVAMLLNKGWSVREIAAHLGVSENTVKTHVKSVYKKLGINSRKDLDRYMLR